MKKILVIEDVADTNDLICSLLEKNNFKTDSAREGTQAIEFLKLETYDLILLDIIMPIQDGFDVIDYIEENEVTTPIIAMSGGGRTVSGSIALKTVQNRVSGTIKKPFKQQEILDLINEVL